MHSSVKFGVLFLLMAVLAGCSTGRWDRLRNKQAADFQQSIAAITEKALGGRSTLHLQDCVDIALEHNLAVKQAEIRRKMAKLERQAAFANFLPTLQFNLNYTALDKAPKSKMFGLLAAQVQDREILTTEWNAQMPIFVPATWLVYDMRRRGAEIAGLVRDYTRQQIVLQITAGYFHCTVIEHSRTVLESQLAASEQLCSEMHALAKEGLIMPWQADRADLLALSRRTALEKTERARDQAVSDLLVAMGLSPLANVTPAVETPLEAPPGNLEELLLQALLNHPQLKISDRMIAIRKDQVLMAIADFLPSLAGFASRSHTSNSFMKYPDVTALGIAGVMTVFDGLSNVRAYQLARQQQKEAYVQREEACFSLMLSVLQAHRSLQDAQADLVLAKKNLEVACGRLTQIEAQWHEGLIQGSDRLTVTSDRDDAEFTVLAAQFSEQVRIAVLRDLIAAPGTAETKHPETNKP
ncbi:MAG TPA: TolC family protein [Candidatus Hydrogenedentes bacterium]|nr:TolC family protein [Candidatus Hydrogenedentota bacterium]